MWEMTDLTIMQNIESPEREISERGDTDSDDFGGTTGFKKQGTRLRDPFHYLGSQWSANEI